MVKITYNSALAQKEPNKLDIDEALIREEADQDVEDGQQAPRQQESCRMGLWLSILVVLGMAGLGGVALMRTIQGEAENPLFSQIQDDEMWECRVVYPDDYMLEEPDAVFPEDYMLEEPEDAIFPEDYMLEEPERAAARLGHMQVEPERAAARLSHIQESIRVLEEEGVELINVPVPEFSPGDPANILHDFNKNLTAYLDLFLNKCYIIPLNTSVVMPPRDLQELLINIKAHTYLPQFYLVRERMMVTERVDDVKELGNFIYNLCHDHDTYMLERRAAVSGIQKREALNCRLIRHFENTFVVETEICEP
ncbi:integral membrane protein 2B-like isoform X2 [Centroberyx gerrardi]